MVNDWEIEQAKDEKEIARLREVRVDSALVKFSCGLWDKEKFRAEILKIVEENR